MVLGLGKGNHPFSGPLIEGCRSRVRRRRLPPATKRSLTLRGQLEESPVSLRPLSVVPSFADHDVDVLKLR